MKASGAASAGVAAGAARVPQTMDVWVGERAVSS